MIETLLIKFYREKLKNYSLVYKRLLINIIIFALCACILLPISYFILIKYIFPLTFKVLFFLIPIMIFFILQHLLINIHSSNLAKESYKIELYSTDWELFRLYLFKEYLVTNKFIDNKNENITANKEKIEMIISLFQQKLDNQQKNKPFSILGSYFNTSFIFLIPIWAAFNNQVFFHGVSLKKGLENIGIISGLLLLLIAMLFMIKKYTIHFNFLSSDYELREVINMLTQLQILQNNDNFSQKHMPQDQQERIIAMVKEYNYNKTKNKNKEKNTTSFFKKYSYFKWNG